MIISTQHLLPQNPPPPPPQPVATQSVPASGTATPQPQECTRLVYFYQIRRLTR